MAKKKYVVKSDFLDKETGQMVTAGEVIEADEERLIELLAADVIGKEVTKPQLDTVKKAVNGGEKGADDDKTG